MEFALPTFPLFPKHSLAGSVQVWAPLPTTSGFAAGRILTDRSAVSYHIDQWYQLDILKASTHFHSCNTNPAQNGRCLLLMIPAPLRVKLNL